MLGLIPKMSSTKEHLGIVGKDFLKAWMSFMLPNQQQQSTQWVSNTNTNILIIDLQ